MTASRKKSIRREVLEHASPALLQRYLTPFVAFFAQHDVDLAALAGEPAAARAVAEKIFLVVHDPSAYPLPKAKLLEALEALDALASRDGAAELVRLDRDRELPRGTHGDADLALVALLDHPDLAAMAAATSSRDPEHKFVEYRAASGDHTFDDATLDRFRDAMADRFHALDHTSFCRIHVLDERGRVDLEIVHGSRPKTRDVVQASSAGLSRVTDVTARRSFVRLDRRSGRLSIRAPFPAVRECIRAAMGVAVAGDPAFYEGGGIYDLAPFHDLERMLSLDGFPDLARVEIRSIKITSADGVTAAFGRGRQDLLASQTFSPIVRSSLAAGACAGVVFYLRRAGESAARVELAANGKNNVAKYERDDARVTSFIERWLRERGVLREVAPEASAAPAPELASPAAGDR